MQPIEPACIWLVHAVAYGDVCPRPSRCGASSFMQLMARNGRLIVIANEEDDEMVDIVNGKYPIVQVSAGPGRGVVVVVWCVCGGGGY